MSIPMCYVNQVPLCPIISISSACLFICISNSSLIKSYCCEKCNNSVRPINLNQNNNSFTRNDSDSSLESTIENLQCFECNNNNNSINIVPVVSSFKIERVQPSND